MNFSLFISKRYLFAKKSQNVINVITAVSIIGVAFGTAGLIVVLSVFNGFGNLVLSLYDDFDPDIKITPSTGKFFNPSDAQYNRIKNAEYVDVLSFTIEENALLRYNERQVLGRVKGIDSNYINTAPLKNKIIDGRFLSNQDQEYMVIPGGGVAYYLGLNLKNKIGRAHV